MGNNLSTIVVPDETDLGPAMRECTSAEREFVVAMFQVGCKNQMTAAILTGRFTNERSASVSACRWMAKPRVLAALDEYTRITMKMGLPLGTNALIDIASDYMHKDRFKAAVELLNRNGHIVETVQRHIVEHELSMKEVETELAKLGYDIKPTNAIEGEFTEVDDDGSEGLEDLIG